MNSIAQIEISRKNLQNNVAQVRAILRKNKNTKNVKIVGAVKANAYGHGVKEVVSIIEKSVDYFQVDDISELREIRQYTNKPVFVFGYVSIEQLPEFVELGGILGVYDLNIAKKLQQILETKKRRLTVHIKIDSFLGRQGIIKSDAEAFFKKMLEFDRLDVEAVYSHFSNIEDTTNLKHAKLQHKDLLEVKEIAMQAGFKNLFHHISATSGFLSDQKNNWGGSILRLGIGLYGLWPSVFLKKSFEQKIKLKPVMRWVTQIAQVKTVPKNFPIGYGLTFITKKETTVAVIPQGYSDGYDRAFSNNGEVLICGKKCPIMGRIAMNMFVVDAGNCAGKISAGDEVVLLGKQGKSEITAEDLADRIGTINYEVVTRVWPKLERKITE